MKNPLFFDFSVDKTTNTITVKREFAAPVDLVWNAWTQADILDQWWAADGWKSFTKSMKFELDGHRHYRMDGPDETVFLGADYL